MSSPAVFVVPHVALFLLIDWYVFYANSSRVRLSRLHCHCVPFFPYVLCCLLPFLCSSPFFCFFVPLFGCFVVHFFVPSLAFSLLAFFFRCAFSCFVVSPPDFIQANTRASHNLSYCFGRQQTNLSVGLGKAMNTNPLYALDVAH